MRSRCEPVCFSSEPPTGAGTVCRVGYGMTSSSSSDIGACAVTGRCGRGDDEWQGARVFDGFQRFSEYYWGPRPGACAQSLRHLPSGPWRTHTPVARPDTIVTRPGTVQLRERSTTDGTDRRPCATL